MFIYAISSQNGSMGGGLRFGPSFGPVLGPVLGPPRAPFWARFRTPFWPCFGPGFQTTAATANPENPVGGFIFTEYDLDLRVLSGSYEGLKSPKNIGNKH